MTREELAKEPADIRYAVGLIAMLFNRIGLDKQQGKRVCELVIKYVDDLVEGK